MSDYNNSLKYVDTGKEIIGISYIAICLQMQAFITTIRSLHSLHLASRYGSMQEVPGQQVYNCVQ